MPILLYLGDHVAEFVANLGTTTPPVGRQFEERLPRCDYLILLDGLDEVPGRTSGEPWPTGWRVRRGSTRRTTS